MNTQQSFWDEEKPEHAVARRTDPHTSWEAAAEMKPERISKIQSAVLNIFRQAIRLTDEELKPRIRLQYPVDSTWRTRRRELVNKGYLRDSGQTKLNSNNRPMIIWELVRK